MEILLIDVDVAGIEVGVVLSVYSSFHHVSPTYWPSMMIGALETIRKYETTNAHLVNDKYAKRRFVEQRSLTASRSILYISETEPDVISKSFSLHARIQN